MKLSVIEPFSLILSIFLLLSCTKKDETTPDASGVPTSLCDHSLLLNGDQFQNAASDEFTIDDYEVNGSCLILTITAEGCTGESWETNLYNSLSFLDSDPPQSSIRLTLQNDEDCSEIISRNVSFDLSILHDNSVNSVPAIYLSIVDTEFEFLYEY